MLRASNDAQCNHDDKAPYFAASDLLRRVAEDALQNQCICTHSMSQTAHLTSRLSPQVSLVVFQAVALATLAGETAMDVGRFGDVTYDSAAAGCNDDVLCIAER